MAHVALPAKPGIPVRVVQVGVPGHTVGLGNIAGGTEVTVTVSAVAGSSRSAPRLESLSRRCERSHVRKREHESYRPDDRDTDYDSFHQCASL